MWCMWCIKIRTKSTEFTLNGKYTIRDKKLRATPSYAEVFDESSIWKEAFQVPSLSLQAYRLAHSRQESCGLYEHANGQSCFSFLLHYFYYS